jgi:hypothetical protein
VPAVMPLVRYVLGVLVRLSRVRPFTAPDIDTSSIVRAAVMPVLIVRLVHDERDGGCRAGHGLLP